MYNERMYSYAHAVVGGTFDHFHAGHKSILDFAFQIAQYVTIGIVGASPIAEKEFPKSMESYLVRKEAINTYIKTKIVQYPT